MLPDATTIGAVTLLVRNLALQRHFYERVLGLPVLKEGAQSVEFGQEHPFLILEEAPELPFPASTSAGLFHTAFLFSSAGTLARTLLSVFQQAGRLFEGPGDHLVSQ